MIYDIYVYYTPVVYPFCLYEFSRVCSSLDNKLSSNQKQSFEKYVLLAEEIIVPCEISHVHTNPYTAKYAFYELCFYVLNFLRITIA